MKISCDDKEIFTLSETQKKVIQNDIPSETFQEDMHRRLKWVLFDEKYCRCMKRLRDEWTPKLAQRGVTFLPTSDEAFAQMVFSQPDYKNRSQREEESKKQLGA